MTDAPIRRLPVPRRSPPPAKLGPLGRPLRAVTSADDREFLPAVLEILETPTSPARIALIWIGLALFALALFWSWLAKLDIYATAPSRVELIGRSKIVQSLEPGKVRALLVANGSKVKKGQVVLELDPTDAAADRDMAAHDLEAAEAEIARRRAEIEAVLTGAPSLPKIDFPQNVAPDARLLARSVALAELSQYASSIRTYQAKLAESEAAKERLIATIASQRHLITILQKVLAMRSELAAKQVGSRLAVLEARQQLDQGLTELASDEGKLREAEAAIVSTERQTAQTQKEFVARQADKLDAAVKRRGDLEQDLVKALEKLKNTRLRAPISGTVQQLAVTTIGQVVTPARPLMVIVPTSGKMVVEALVASRDFGFIRVGQKAVIKLDAFPFMRYGALNGKVVSIAHDAVYAKEAATADAASLSKGDTWMLNAIPQIQGLAYPVYIALDRNWVEVNGRKVPLTAGMTGSIEIRTGTRRAISYLLSPLGEMASEAGHER